MLLHKIAQLLAFFDRLDLGRLQGATGDKPHAAPIADQPLNAARRQRQGVGIEVSGQPVVALGGLQRGDVEQFDEVAVIQRVFEVPGTIAEHGQASSSCQSFSCPGSSISSP